MAETQIYTLLLTKRKYNLWVLFSAYTHILDIITLKLLL